MDFERKRNVDDGSLSERHPTSQNQPGIQFKIKDEHMEDCGSHSNSQDITDHDSPEVSPNFISCGSKDKRNEQFSCSSNESLIFIKEERIEAEDVAVKQEELPEQPYSERICTVGTPETPTNDCSLEGQEERDRISSSCRGRVHRSKNILNRRSQKKPFRVSRSKPGGASINTELNESSEQMTEDDSLREEHQERRCGSRPVKESENPSLVRNLSKVIKKKKRRYDENYIDFGFVCLNRQDSPRPQCVLCSRVLANGSMKPSSLKRHLQTLHPDCVGKTREFFLRMRETMGEPPVEMVEEVDTISESQGVFDIYHTAAEKIVSVSGSSHHPPSHHDEDPDNSSLIYDEEMPESDILQIHQQIVDLSAETKNETSHHQPMGSIRMGKKRNLIRKYDENYIEFGFACLYKQNSPRPQCVLCSRILANESMRPSNLKRHLQTNHPEYVTKPKEFFQQMLNKLRESPADSRSPPPVKELSFTKKALMASYLVSLRIAKSKKAHVIGKTLIQPAAIEMCEKVLGKDAAEQIKTIPLSNTTVRRRIGDLAEDVKRQLVAKMKCSPYFALLLDESTDIANILQIFCYVRYVGDSDVEEDLLFYKEVSPLTSGLEVFELLNNFLATEGLEWSKFVGLCTDGSAPATGEIGGFVQRVHDVAPHAKWIHCLIKRESLASIELGQTFHEVLNTALKVVNFIKLRSVDSACYASLCDEMGKDQHHVLLNTEVRWLSRGNVLKCLFDLRDDLRMLLEKSPLAEHFRDPKFLAYLSYLSVILGKVNSCYSSLHDSTSTLLDLSDQIGRLMANIDLWKKQISAGVTEIFTSLDSFLAENGDAALKTLILKDIKDHLTALKIQLHHNFRELRCDQCEWVRSPFSVTVESIDHLPVKAQEDFIDLLYDRRLQMTFPTKTITEFWVGASQDYSKIRDEALKLILPFASVSLSEAGFSAMAEMKSKFRNRLAIASDLRLCLTNIEPNIARLCEERQAQPSH